MKARRIDGLIFFLPLPYVDCKSVVCLPFLIWITSLFIRKGSKNILCFPCFLMDCIIAILLGKKKHRTREMMVDRMQSLIFRALFCFGTVQNWEFLDVTQPFETFDEVQIWWIPPLSSTHPPCSVWARISPLMSWGNIQQCSGNKSLAHYCYLPLLMKR